MRLRNDDRRRVRAKISFTIFRKFTEIFASQGAPTVSTTPGPVSTTPAANFATDTIGVLDTGGKSLLVSTTPESMTLVAYNGNQTADTLQ